MAAILTITGVVASMYVVPFFINNGQQNTSGVSEKVPTKQTTQQSSHATNSTTQTTLLHRDETSHTTTNVATKEQRAPKQAAIEKTITREFPYHALRLPNDTYAQTAWSLSALTLPSAWDLVTGSGVVVAVIDTGFGLSHEDLTQQWHQNLAETGTTQPGGRCWVGVSINKSTNNCDDDNNGYVDDYRGWDFVHVNNLPTPGETNAFGQGVSHGTEVAGLVGMTGNNGLGSATASWNTKIMPLQVLDDDGSGYTSDVVAAIYYAVDNGARVINMSLGGYDEDPALQPAIDYAYQRNVLVVAAAGNCGTGQESGCDTSAPGRMSYPAVNPHVLSVGAIANGNTRASFSSYGEALDVVAPGSGNIVTPMWQSANQSSAYAGTIYGTSFSSPYVASIAALIKSIRPSTSVDDMTALIDGTATKVSAMNGNPYTVHYGHGVVNANTALQVAMSLNTTTSQPTLLQTGGGVAEHTFSPNGTLGSDCIGSTNTYCSVRFLYGYGGYDRYLPYQNGGLLGRTGWSWSTNILSSGEWQVHAIQGDRISTTPYILSSK